MKRHHKIHHHKDVNRKRSSKSKHHHKQHKKEHPASEGLLEPIQEVSKEKVKVDKNACGDYVNSVLEPQIKDERKKKRKHRSERKDKTEKIEKLAQEDTDIFAKNYLQKIRTSTKGKLVRHHSLEKSGDSLINKSKKLFRKEKSFNDAVQKVGVDLEISKEHKKEKKQRLTCRKEETEHKNRDKLAKKDDNDGKGEILQNNVEKRKKSAKKKSRSKEKPRLDAKNRVQEVIYCQLDQVPYKLKNDKSGAEIKDLYQRIKREERCSKEERRASMDISRSHGQRNKSCQSRHSPILGKMNVKEEKKNERSKSRPKRVPEETIQKEEELPETCSREDKSKDRHQNRQSYHEQERLNSSKHAGRNRKKECLSNVDLGPYQQYFIFENKHTPKIYKKHHRRDEEHRKGKGGSRDTNQAENREEVIYNVDYDGTLCKKNYERHHKKEPAVENRIKTAVDKIPQNVEVDLKTYFSKIQHMIDEKLDAILQINKSNAEKAINKNTRGEEKRKRSRSKSKHKKPEKEERSGSKKEDKNKKVEETKSKSTEVKDDNIRKEEIIQEVLKRIKNEAKKEMENKEKRSKAKTDKDDYMKHESMETGQKIGKNDRKNSKDMAHSSKKRPDISLVQNIDKSHSKSKDIPSIQKSSSKRHRESVKDLEQINFELKDTQKSSDRKQLYEEAMRPQDVDHSGQKDPDFQDNRKSCHVNRKVCRHSRSPDNICNLSNLRDPQEILLFRRSLDKKKSRNRSSPPPAADISSLDWEAYLRSNRRHKRHADIISRKEKEMSRYYLTKHYTSASSCRACSEHQLVPSAECRVAEHRSEQVVIHQHSQKHVASAEISRKPCHLGDRRRSSSQVRCNHMPKDTNPTRDDQNHISYRPNDIIPSAFYEPYCRREDLMASRPEDYIMAPREFRIPTDRFEGCIVHNFCQEPLNHNPDRRPSRHDMVVKDPNLDNVILPPETFRSPGRTLNEPGEFISTHQRLRSPERQRTRKEFVVQGIEPPILECSRRKSRRQIRTRKMECKTVSIVEIPPQITVKALPMANHTQTSSKFHKSATPDRDLVEKRKHSKRFKLYYKYSIVDNSKEDQNSGSSDVKSIVSDSYRVISDPSDEENAVVCNSREILNTVPKKWNKIATPRDSHLKNIIEEPSNISNSIKNDEYFIPIRGTNECYFRALTSSHSEYCFRINKKPANSNINILSKETCDGRYRYYEDGRCRYCKYGIRSKSEVHLGCNGHAVQIFKSKSEVFLRGASGRKVIKSIFLEDTHPYVRSRRPEARSNQNYVSKNGFNGKTTVKTIGKDCQTSDVKVNYNLVPVEEQESKLVFEDKERQFKDIYKTIDDLEENIYSSRQAPPNTLDVAVSSKFLSLDEISDKKPQFNKIYETIDNLEDKVIHTSNKELVQKVDVAIGSSVKTHMSQRGSRSEPRKNTHEIAVGDNKHAVLTNARTLCHRSESGSRKLKSTGVSPIRVVEDLQTSSKTPTRKTVTPMSPNKRPHRIMPSTQKPARNIREDSPLKKTTPIGVESKREPSFRSSIKPKITTVKDTALKSPERRQIGNEDLKNLKKVDVSQPGQGIRVFRSEEKSANLKKNENTVENRLRESKPVETITKITSQQNQIHQKKEAAPKDTSFVENAICKSADATNNTQVSSKASVRKAITKEKGDVLKKLPTRHHADDVHKSCVHHFHPRDLNVEKSSGTTAATEKTPSGTTKKPLFVNTALFKGQPSTQKAVIPSEGSTSSSVSNGTTQNIRRSRSLVEIRTQRRSVHRSKSEIISVEKAFVLCPSSGLETNGGSLISDNMEKFTNMPKLRCHSSKSNVHSLDQFIGSKFASRLFLTKDYKSGEISAYQRRKLYDQSMRQKMKKKFRFSKLDVGPQIFEVRFLSMVSQENAQRKEREIKMKHCIERPLFTLSLDGVKTESSVSQKEAHNPMTVKNEGQVRRDKIEDIFINVNNSLGDQDDFSDNKQLDHYLVTENNLKLMNGEQSTADKQQYKINTNCNDDAIIKNISTKGQSVTELYFKDEKINQEKLLSFCNKLLQVNSNLQLLEGFKEAQCTCSKYSDNCQSCKHFVNLMNILCSSVASYCQSKTELIDFELEPDFKFNRVENGNQYVLNNATNVKVDKQGIADKSDNLHVHLPNLEMQKVNNNVQEIFSRGSNNSSRESNEFTDQSDKIFKNSVECVSLTTSNRTNDIPSLSQPLSCPVLPSNSSSFEFLYEETSSSDNDGIAHDMVLANLTRPFDQTFNISMSQYNVETPFLRRNSYFSGTGSSESGYASVKSKSCVETNFFKKPNIAALFKPPILKRRGSEVSKCCEQKGQGDFKKSVLYEEMAKSCQLYAKKVRESSEMRLREKVEVYQEFSLACLLGRNSSVVLESTALMQHSSTVLYNEDDTLNRGIKSEAFDDNDGCSDAGCNNNEFLKNSKVSFVENGCRLVLSNECLKIDSITYLGAEIFNEQPSDLGFKMAKESQNDFLDNSSKHDHEKVSFKGEDSCFTLDFSLDSNNPFVPSKDAVTQKFFGCLLKAYEKEIEICNELFKNDEFLKNVLLPAIRERRKEEKRSKKSRLSRLFRKKLTNKQTSSEKSNCEWRSNLQVKASTKLQSLASNAKKCFTMLAEAVKLNERIDDEIKICGLLKLLERIENGDFYVIKNDGASNVEEDIESQVKEAFINIYEICEKEAKKAKRNIGDQELDLIKRFVSKYRIGLLSKTDVVACNVGRGIIQTEAQLKAAVLKTFSVP